MQLHSENSPERLVFAAEGHFLTEGGGYAMRAYVGVPSEQLSALPQHPFGDYGSLCDTMPVAAFLIPPRLPDHKQAVGA
ncbi:hypothetical protein LJR099_003025 [Variovorax paradoxus]|uniref:hypothetical protein n=1 Tax=Variovorax paradoxus TaxID=34073 RepID=UPI00399C3354